MLRDRATLCWHGPQPGLAFGPGLGPKCTVLSLQRQRFVILITNTWRVKRCLITATTTTTITLSHGDFAPLKWLGYFFGSWEKLQPRRVNRFWRKIRQTTRFRARKCLLGVAKPKSKVSTPIFPQNSHFWAPFRRDLEFFRPKTALTLDRSRE